MIGLLFALSAALPPLPDPSEILVVTNKQASTVSILSLATGKALATLPTGAGPHEATASADGRWAVVTNYGAQQPGNSLTVVDLASLTVARTIDLGTYTRPHGAIFLLDNKTVAVTSETTGFVVLVDVTSGQITGTRPTGQAVSHMVAVAADGRRAFTANIQPGTISAVDLVAGEPRILQVSTQTEAIGVAPDASQAWVGSNDKGTVSTVNIAQWKVTDTLAVGSWPYRISFSPDGRRVLVTTPNSDEIWLFDAAARRQTGRLKVAGAASRPYGIIWHPDGKSAYITLTGLNQVGVLDVDRMALTQFLDVGAAPDGIAYARRRN
ncbi:MAG: hypothetical protein HOP28_02425 [Gemmatimonadales bacterium]|nr:hypothetical protein [Gemmatimonadales bacterium]